MSLVWRVLFFFKYMFVHMNYVAYVGYHVMNMLNNIVWLQISENFQFYEFYSFYFGFLLSEIIGFQSYCETDSTG